MSKWRPDHLSGQPLRPGTDLASTGSHLQRQDGYKQNVMEKWSQRGGRNQRRKGKSKVREQLKVQPGDHFEWCWEPKANYLQERCAWDDPTVPTVILKDGAIHAEVTDPVDALMAPPCDSFSCRATPLTLSWLDGLSSTESGLHVRAHVGVLACALGLPPHREWMHDSVEREAQRTCYLFRSLLPRQAVP